MSGAIVQLISTGAQDARLTGGEDHTKVSMFKDAYLRITNFATEYSRQNFSGEPNFGKNATCILARSGDLVEDLSLHLTLPALERSWFTIDGVDLTDAPGIDTATGGAVSAAQVPDIKPAYVESIGHAVIEEVQLDIGGQNVDKQYGMWMEILCEHTLSGAKYEQYGRMIGRFPTLGEAAVAATLEQTFHIPLHFWFCRNPQLALPLLSMQGHDVRVVFKFRPMDQCVILTDGNKRFDADGAGVTVAIKSTERNNIRFSSCQLYASYVYLDKDERNDFITKPQEYLIETVQYSEESISLNVGNQQVNHKLSFSHPVKELVWVVQQQSVAPVGTGDLTKNDWFNFGQNDLTVNDPTAILGLPDDLLDNRRQSNSIRFNNQDRISPQPASYFRYQQPARYHTRIPQKPIYSYSFALYPERHQPSGSANMSRIDTANLVLRMGDSIGQGLTPFGANKSGNLFVFARSYNFIKIQGGLAGVVFAS